MAASAASDSVTLVADELDEPVEVDVDAVLELVEDDVDVG
jgi:hypothetical protein